MRKKIGIGVLCSILFILAIFLLFSNKIHYNILNRVEPEDMSSTDYVKLESEGTVRQVISLTRIGYLKDIEVILINLSEETDDAVLNAKIRKNGKTVKQTEYIIRQENAGEWSRIPIGKTLYPGCEYEIEFTMQDDNRNDTPYLVTQDIEGASRYHRQLLLDGESINKSVVISYDFYDVIPFDIKLIISVLCLIISGGIVCFALKKNYIDLYVKYIIPAILIIMLIPIFVITKYSRPCVDDFVYSYGTHRLVEEDNYNTLDLLKTAYDTDKQFYLTWQGLYTSAFLLALQPGIFGEKYYFIGGIGLLIFMYLTLYLSVWFVKKRFCKNRKRTWLWSLVLFSIIVQGMPSAVQGLYWYNGAVNYMPFVFLTILNMALMLEYAFSGGGQSIVCIVVSVLLSFTISGGNHVTAFLNIMCLLVACIILLPKKKIGVLFSLASALAGFWIMYRAPGTALRWGVLEKSTVLITIMECGKKCLENMADWMNIQWVCYLLLLLPFSFEIADYCRGKRLKYHPLILFMISITILVGMQCVPYYAMSYWGDGRLQNVIWVAFIILSEINMTYLFVWIENKRNFEFMKEGKKYKFNFCAIIISLGLCWFGCDGESTSIQALNEMFSTGIAQAYAFSFDERCSLMDDVWEDEAIYVDPLPYSTLLRFNDISSDIEDWRNIAWRDYYGKTLVIKQ